MWSRVSNFSLEQNALGKVIAIDLDLVVGEGAWSFYAVFFADLDAVEQGMAGSGSECRVMLEDEERAGVHASSRAGSGLIELERIHKRFEQKLEVVLAEAGLLCEERVHETVGAVEGIGNGELAAHGAFLFGVFFVRYRGARDGVLTGDDGVDGTGE